MKKTIAILLTAVMSVSLLGCGKEPIQTSAPPETTAAAVPTETTVPETTAPVVIDDSMVCLDEVLEGSGIEIDIQGDGILLTEDELTLEMNPDSPLVYRGGYIAAVMDASPILAGGKVYVPERFVEDFLRREDSVSLFHGVYFFPEEILAAAEDPDASAFNQKIAAEVLLPSSMGIETPHVDMDRAFQYQLLSNYSAALAQELEALGYENVTAYTYTEYVILSGGQTLEQAGITANMTGGISYDPEMTVAELNQLRRQKDKADYLDSVTEEQQAFATEKGLETVDMQYLQRMFGQNDFMNESDETLRETLEESYEATLGYLKDLTNLA